MKSMNIRLNDGLANWLIGRCQKNKVTISEFIRDLLYEKMQQGSIDINKLKKVQCYKEPPHYRTEIGYIIFTAKLLERFILATQETGMDLRNTAFKETEELLVGLNLNRQKNKVQKICFKLEESLFLWLSNELVRLQIPASKLIRMLIEDLYAEDCLGLNYQSSEIQKFSIGQQITACKLLEALISNVVSNGSELVEEARGVSKEIVLQLN